VHPHDIGTILDESRVAIRAGHHCAQPLMAHLGVDSTARASFGVYNGPRDIAALVRGLDGSEGFSARDWIVMLNVFQHPATSRRTDGELDPGTSSG
jgi:hypothetical protein